MMGVNGLYIERKGIGKGTGTGNCKKGGVWDE